MICLYLNIHIFLSCHASRGIHFLRPAATLIWLPKLSRVRRVQFTRIKYYIDDRIPKLPSDAPGKQKVKLMEWGSADRSGQQLRTNTEAEPSVVGRDRLLSKMEERLRAEFGVAWLRSFKDLNCFL